MALDRSQTIEQGLEAQSIAPRITLYVEAKQKEVVESLVRRYRDGELTTETAWAGIGQLEILQRMPEELERKLQRMFQVQQEERG